MLTLTKCLVILLSVHIAVCGEAEDDWIEDDPKGSRQITFPSSSEDECEGNSIQLRAGEATVARSHRSYGKFAYEKDYRCKWVVQPVECDLSIVCRMKTREGRGSGARCSGADYLRIMRGNGRKVEFQKKYCGRQTASIKFSGNQKVKLLFKTGISDFRIGNSDGWTCKLVCMPQNGKPAVVFQPSTTTTTATTSTLTTTTSEPTSTASTSSTESTKFEERECECGRVPPEARIICPPGRNCTAQPGSIPWQVALVDRNGRKPFCGGTLINSRYVLTAAHCLEHPRRRTPANINVVLGDHDWTKAGETADLRYSVTKVQLHSQFRQGAHFNYDFAIVKLSRPVDFVRIPWVRPACLPQQYGSKREGLSGLVSGWGVTNINTKTQATALQMVSVNLMEHNDCVNHYSDREVTENMVCATAPGADACYGDSGGPLTVQVGDRSELVGVVSWGMECGRPQWPGVYSRVSMVLDWVRRNTFDGDYCETSRNRDSSVRWKENRGERRAG